jgi:hypothetical protein
MMTYEETMRYGAAQYADVIAALNRCGLPAEFTQTGGMCAAIEVTLEAGYYLLLTDRDDTLAWERRKHEGWFVGLYEPEERRTADGPLRYAESSDGSAEAALALVAEVLPGAVRQANDPARRTHARRRVARTVPRAAEPPTSAHEGPSLI